MQRQQLDLELRAGELAVGSVSVPSRSAARAIASASIGSDFPRSWTRGGRWPSAWGEAHDRLAAIDQEPLQRPRHVPDVLDHPHSLAVELARPLQQVTESLTPGRIVRCAICTPSGSTATPECVCLCGSIPIVNIPTVPSLE